MTVGVVGALGPDSFAENILSGLESIGLSGAWLGSTHLRFRSRVANSAWDYASLASHRFASTAQGDIPRNAGKANCQLVISVDPGLLPETVARLRGTGIPAVFWFPDPAGSVGRHLWLAAPYERIYLKDPALTHHLASLTGVDVQYLPEACNPLWHRATERDRPGDDPRLLMVGSMYPARLLLLNRLRRDGVPVTIHGPSPRGFLPRQLTSELHFGAPLYRGAKARRFRRALGVLNSMHPTEMNSVNARLFETAGCGGASITEYRPGLRELFEPGSEVLTFNTYEELVRAVRALEDDPSLAQRIGDAASARAHREHTYAHRLTRILTEVL